MKTILRLPTFATGLLLSLVFLTGTGTPHAQSIYEPYFFTHMAGLALNAGDTNNTGDLARFNQPWGVAVDGAGNVYVADTLNHTVRRITPNGAVTLLAGVSGLAGFNDGPVASALFSRPTGVAVNTEGSVVYVADSNNSLVRQISGGVVSTLAGSAGVFGSADGTGTAAEFNRPFGVALNSETTVLYVTDQSNQTIRAIALPGAVVTTLAGATGVPGSTDDPANNLNARFNTPRGIAVDGDGSIYVADTGNFTIRKILSTGGVSTLAGSVFTPGFDDGAGGAALFSALSAMSPFGGPCGVAVDGDGNLYVTDQGNQTIRKITPGGSVTTLAGLAQNAGADDGTGSDARFRFPAGIAVDVVGNVYVADTANHTIRIGENPADEHCPAAPPMDADGNLILPDGLDPELINYVEINQILGTLEEQFPDWDTSTDLWYPNLECLQSVGGTVPDEASNPDLIGALTDLGITGVTPEEIMATIEDWNEQIADQALTEIIGFSTAGPASSDYTPPEVPYCPDPEKKYAFGGRDIIFVHGLQLGHVMQKIAGNPAAEQTWVTPGSFPGSTDNPEFYDGGYFKTVAENIWEEHIIKFLWMNGYENRYLIVSYPCAERLEVGAQAILTQISDAMQFGTGVKHVRGIFDSNEPYDTSNFGTPSFVVVSHSTGTILTDVAMTAAAQNPNLAAGFIPQMAKAHVAMDGVFSGSDLATAAIAISGFINQAPLAWTCALAGAGVAAFDPEIQAPDCNLFGAFASSILVDLVPLVSQLKWGSHVNETPVRTITLIGGHPTMLQPLKFLLHPGFDDGVTTINSQVANPNSRLLWPSGFRPVGTGLIGTYDMGLAGSGNGPQSGLMSPIRANGYYIDQVIEPFRLPPILIAGGALPYLSPSGMRQDVVDGYENTQFSTLNRYNNHFSYIQSASDHLTGYTGTIGFYGKDYFVSGLNEPNREESRVITDPAVYHYYEMVYPGDNAPLLNASCMPKVESWERGRLIPQVSFKLFGRQYKWGPYWVWRRVYDLLEGWEDKMGCDYMYESVLQCPPLATCTRCDEPFIIDGPADKTVDCGSAWQFDPPTATGVGIIITPTGIESDGLCPASITQTWLITDECGNSAERSQTVTVVDNAPPVIECPPRTIVVALDKNCQLEIPTIQPAASDDCTPRGQLIYTQNPPAGEIVSGPCQLVTVTVTDACNKVSTCEVMVCGIDKNPPTLICPDSVMVSDCTVPDVLPLVSAFDNCTPESRLIFKQSPLAGTSIAAGGNQVSVTVADEEGNTATCIIPINTSGPASFLDVMFNTGVDSNKVTLGTGAYELHYTLDAVPTGTPTGLGYYNAPKAVVLSGGWGWPLPPFATSGWILPYLPYGGTYTEAGSYTYTKQFVLPSGVDPLMASLSGRWTVVGEGKMYLNGLAAQNQVSSVVTPPGTNNWTNFTVNAGFLPFPAINNLSFVVTNGSGYGDYSKFPALRVEFTDAVVNCHACTPPVVLEKPRPQSLPLNSTAIFHANVSGTPPFSIQWYHNNLPLSNGGHYSGVTTATLTVTPLGYADAGMYRAVISNPCGEISSLPAKLTISKGWPWSWQWWNFADIGRPMKAAIGSDLILEGTNGFGISSGTTTDFGLPNPDGKPVNVMVVPPLPAGTFIRMPQPQSAGDNSLRDFTIIVDVYSPPIPSSSLIKIVEIIGNQSPEESLSLSSVAGAAGEGLSLTGIVGGTPVNLMSSISLLPDSWNRIGLRSRMSANEASASGALKLTIFLNGRPAGTITVTPVNDPPSFASDAVVALFSSPDGSAAESYVSSIQYHAMAFTSETMAEIGGPDTGPITVSDTSAGLTPGQPELPALTVRKAATEQNEYLEITWANGDGSDFLLEETSDLTSGLWTPCLLPFSQTEVNGRITTTAYVDPMTQGRVKFYRVKGIPLR